MPPLSLAYTIHGLDPLAFVSEEMRTCWRATVSLELECMKEQPDLASWGALRQIDLQALRQLLRAPEPIKAQVSQAIQHGTMAGDILRLIASMAQEGRGGSVRKAEQVLLKDDYKAGETLGGKKVSHNATTLRKVWSMYKPVAHLWAAYRHGLIWSQIIPDAGVWAHPFSAECLPRLFRLAEEYRTFGLHHSPHPQKEPLLANTDLWVVQTPTDPPWPTGVHDLPALTLAQSQQDVLTAYIAQPNRYTPKKKSQKD